MSMLGIYPFIDKKLAYDPIADLTPVSLGANCDFGFAVGPAVPASIRSMGEFLAWWADRSRLSAARSGSSPSPLPRASAACWPAPAVCAASSPPGVPTLLEQGFKDMAFNEWFGFYRPGKASADVVQRANTALRAALASPDGIEGLEVMGLEARSSTPAELATMLKAHQERWAPLIRAIGFSADS